MTTYQKDPITKISFSFDKSTQFPHETVYIETDQVKKVTNKRSVYCSHPEEGGKLLTSWIGRYKNNKYWSIQQCPT